MIYANAIVLVTTVLALPQVFINQHLLLLLFSLVGYNVNKQKIPVCTTLRTFTAFDHFGSSVGTKAPSFMVKVTAKTATFKTKAKAKPSSLKTKTKGFNGLNAELIQISKYKHTTLM